MKNDFVTAKFGDQHILCFFFFKLKLTYTYIFFKDLNNV